MWLVVFMVDVILSLMFVELIPNMLCQEASLVFRYPSTISAESAATIPLAAITAALGLFHEMDLPLPPASSGAPILVWGGSTSVGQYTIQLAKAAGCYVITTASPARHAYLKELGADVCFDYKDSNVVAEIKKASKDNLSYAFDSISENGSTAKVCETLTGKNPQLITVLPLQPNEIPSNVTQCTPIMYTIFGYDLDILGMQIPAKPQDKEFAKKFYQLLADVLLPKGLVKPNKVTKNTRWTQWSRRRISTHDGK